jgi:hypothetical protein
LVGTEGWKGDGSMPQRRSTIPPRGGIPKKGGIPGRDPNEEGIHDLDAAAKNIREGLARAVGGLAENVGVGSNAGEELAELRRKRRAQAAKAETAPEPAPPEHDGGGVADNIKEGVTGAVSGFAGLPGIKNIVGAAASRKTGGMGKELAELKEKRASGEIAAPTKSPEKAHMEHGVDTTVVDDLIAQIEAAGATSISGMARMAKDKVLEDKDLTVADKQEAVNYVEVIGRQALSDNPDKAKIRSAMDGIKSVLSRSKGLSFYAMFIDQAKDQIDKYV